MEVPPKAETKMKWLSVISATLESDRLCCCEISHQSLCHLAHQWSILSLNFPLEASRCWHDRSWHHCLHAKTSNVRWAWPTLVKVLDWHGLFYWLEISERLKAYFFVLQSTKTNSSSSHVVDVLNAFWIFYLFIVRKGWDTRAIIFNWSLTWPTDTQKISRQQSIIFLFLACWSVIKFQLHQKILATCWWLSSGVISFSNSEHRASIIV